MNPIHIIGTGLHSALGKTTQECVTALRASNPFDAETGANVKNLSHYACSLPEHEMTIPYYLLKGVSENDVQTRLHAVLFDVIAQATSEAELSEEDFETIGLFVGSSSFEIADEEERFKQTVNDDDSLALAECGMGNLSERIRKHLNINGPDFTFNTACTSSANAMLYAGQLIDQGVIDYGLVVAVEFVNETTTYGFHGLQLLSPTALLPFDDRRDGLVLGESCSAAVLCNQDIASQHLKNKTRSVVKQSSESKENISIDNNVSSVIRLLGGANLCDTHSMSITHEEGDIVANVITQALENSALTPEAISIVKCHGTATPGGDLAEANGVKRAFSQSNHFPVCTAIKPFIGHTLGACGLSEFILFCCALQQGFLPATPTIASEGNQLGVVLNQNISLKENKLNGLEALKDSAFLLNYFGFGGNNTSLVVDIHHFENAPKSTAVKGDEHG